MLYFRWKRYRVLVQYENLFSALDSAFIRRYLALLRFPDRFYFSCIGSSVDVGTSDFILGAMSKEGPEPDNTPEIRRLEAASTSLRKQHLWNVIGDEEFKTAHQDLQRKQRALEPKPSVRSTPNPDRAAELLRDRPALWEYPGVTPEQRRDLAREVFEEIRIRNGNLVAVKPRPQYAPLFAYSLWKENRVGGEQSP